jgi:hypothetical protein
MEASPGTKGTVEKMVNLERYDLLHGHPNKLAQAATGLTTPDRQSQGSSATQPLLHA